MHRSYLCFIKPNWVQEQSYFAFFLRNQYKAVAPFWCLLCVRGTIIGFLCNLSSASFRASCSVYATLLSKCAFKAAYAIKSITEFIMYLIHQYLTCSFIWCSVGAGPAIIWHVSICIICICFILFSGALQLGLLDASIVCKLNILLSCRLPITLLIIFSMFSTSMSWIPSSAGPSPGTTKNLHFTFYLCVVISLYTHIFVQHLTDCMFLVWLNCFCGMQCSWCWFWK